MEHRADEFDAGWFVRILLFEMHHEPKGAVLEGSVRGTDYDCIPTRTGVSVVFLEYSTSARRHSWENGLIQGYGGTAVPSHNVIGDGTGAHACRGIGLHALEVAHQSSSRGGRHLGVYSVLSCLYGVVCGIETQKVGGSLASRHQSGERW